MKYVLSIIALVFTLRCSAQTPNATIYNWVNGAEFNGKLKLPSDTPANAKPNSIALIAGKLFVKNETWREAVGADSMIFLTYSSADDRYVKRGRKAPQVTAGYSTGSQYMEYATTATGADTTVSDTYTAGRFAADASNAATSEIASIIFDGVAQTFSQPAVGASVGGAKQVTITKNVNKTVSCVVTTVTGETAQASITHTWASVYYIGYVPNTNPTDAQLIAAGYNIFPCLTRLRPETVMPAPPTQSYVAFAVPASFGTPVIKISGNEVTYLLITRPVTGAKGDVRSYNICILPNATSGAVTFQIL